MKKLSFILFLSIIISCKGNENKPIDSTLTKVENQDNKLKRYQVQSGIIKFKTTITGKVMGSTITGSGTVSKYFKDFGALELIEENSEQTTVTVVFGNKTTNTTSSHTMNKLDNGTSYSVDFKQKQIYKHQDLAMELTKQFHPNADAGEVGENMFKAIGGKKIGTENYQGYNCEIWESMGIKQWIYKGATLKSVGTLMGVTTTQEAIDIKFDTNIADSNFKLPNYPIVEQEKMLGGVEFASEDFDADYDDIQADMNRLKNMSYEEWKQLATADDEEMQDMSEDELRQTYDMIQKMIKMRQ